MTESHEPAAPAEEQRHMRAIKSFVMRAGRMTEGQQRGLEQGLPKFGLEQAFIGVEVHRPGVGALLNGALAQNLSNIRVYTCDALEVLRDCVADASLDRVLLYFPDPWHKARHHKRRIVKAEFAELVRHKLKVGGVLHMATDWEPYAEYMLEVMQVAPGYRNLAADGRCVERPSERPVTKFERRGERLGHGVWDLKFARVD